MSAELTNHRRDPQSEADFSRTRVLVTGAAGFFGRHLCRALAARGARVFGVSRRGDAADGAETIAGDCADLEFVRGAMATARPDVIYHLAGSADGSRELDRVVPGLQDDLVSTVTLLTAATEHGVGSIIVTGSMEEPDFAAGDFLPASPYAAAKLCVNFYARMFHAVYGAPVTLLRPFVTYGPGQHETKLIPYVIRSLLARRAPRLSSCDRGVDLVFVDDMIEAFLRSARVPPCPDGIELGSGRLVALRDVIERIARLMNAGVEPEFGALADRKQEQVRTAQVERAIAGLGWQATTPLDEGLRRTIEWYRLHPTTPQVAQCAVS